MRAPASARRCLAELRRHLRGDVASPLRASDLRTDIGEIELARDAAPRVTLRAVDVEHANRFERRWPERAVHARVSGLRASVGSLARRPRACDLLRTDVGPRVPQRRSVCRVSREPRGGALDRRTRLRGALRGRRRRPQGRPYRVRGVRRRVGQGRPQGDDPGGRAGDDGLRVRSVGVPTEAPQRLRSLDSSLRARGGAPCDEAT